jgi:hypothetical protein
MPTNIADFIRNALRTIVAKHGALEEASSIMETTLIRNGTYCGRRFSLEGFSLVWFQEESQIKLYAPDGQLELSCSLSDFCAIQTSDSTSIRRAA